ncbi:putative dicarboxylic amino acid permease protein [Neofusicoccum parvum UCRNP2]|uniref:Putative dicarboxylic amino acid permease protein n=1 Tax=Botryosphaeria parva (strain UCR-NP2) TaxID=1287680 RepID=R1EM96_BOTPV|nr:putative dicarboxylic amino acid permease protein [Neofusicoccum parvum UCRNP2]
MSTDCEDGKKAPHTHDAAIEHDVGQVSNQEGLRRDFKPRHVSMIAIAGAIGTGLIIGSGTGLVRGGPASLFIAYIAIGSVVYFLMTALGEMATMCPMEKGFAGYATRFVDPALGYAAGWNYFFKYAIVLPNNLTAAGMIIQYWRPDLNIAIFVVVFIVVILAINVLHVTFFGEAEFWMSLVKLLVMVVLILTCLIISLGGQPSGDRIGFRYWRDPGAFGTYLHSGPTGRFLGLWACMVQACFAYTGTEVVGAAFGETPNPRKNIPKAIRQTLWRICSFYVLGALVLGMAVPHTNDMLVGATKQKTGASASPFVVAVTLAGIPTFPDVINACLLIFVLSAANSDVYIGSRTLYGLARDGQAPRVFARTLERNGVPIVGVLFTAAFAVLAFMNVAKSSSTVFGYFVSLVTVFGTLNWISILVSYVQFTRAMKAQGIGREQLPYRGPLQPYGAYAALGVTMLITFFNGYNAFIPTFNVSTFMTSYIGIMVYLFNIASWKIKKETKAVDIRTMDLSIVG